MPPTAQRIDPRDLLSAKQRHELFLAELSYSTAPSTAEGMGQLMAVLYDKYTEATWTAYYKEWLASGKVVDLGYVIGYSSANEPRILFDTFLRLIKDAVDKSKDESVSVIAQELQKKYQLYSFWSWHRYTSQIRRFGLQGVLEAHAVSTDEDEEEEGEEEGGEAEGAASGNELGSGTVTVRACRLRPSVPIDLAKGRCEYFSPAERDEIFREAERKVSKPITLSSICSHLATKSKVYTPQMWQELYQEWKSHDGRPPGYEDRPAILLSSGMIDRLVKPYSFKKKHAKSANEEGIAMHRKYGVYAPGTWTGHIRAARASIKQSSTIKPNQASGSAASKGDNAAKSKSSHRQDVPRKRDANDKSPRPKEQSSTSRSNRQIVISPDATSESSSTNAPRSIDVNASNLDRTSPEHLDHVFTKMRPAIEANNIDEFHLSRILDRQYRTGDSQFWLTQYDAWSCKSGMFAAYFASKDQREEGVDDVSNKRQRRV